MVRKLTSGGGCVMVVAIVVLGVTPVKGGVKPWRGAGKNRSAQSYVYPGQPGAWQCNLLSVN